MNRSILNARRALRALVTGSLTALFGLALIRPVPALSSRYSATNVTTGVKAYFPPIVSFYYFDTFGTRLNNIGQILVPSVEAGESIQDLIWQNGAITTAITGPTVGLNNVGKIVGGGSIWQNGTWYGLGLVPSLYSSIQATAINDYGDVVGSGSGSIGNDGFVYSPRTVRFPQVNPPALVFDDLGGGYTRPLAVSNSLMVGSSYKSGGLQHAVVGKYGYLLHSRLINGRYSFYITYYANVYDLTPSYTGMSTAVAINNQNQILVQYPDVWGNTPTSLCTYNPTTNTTTTPIALKSPYAYSTDVTGLAINDAGDSVGSAIGNYNGQKIRIALAFNPMGWGEDLTFVTTGLPQGVWLTEAHGINSSGQILAVANTNDVYLLTPVQ